MLSVTMRCVRARTHACTCLSHGFPAEKNRPTYMPRGYRSWMLGHDLGSILIHAMPCHVMLRTLLCPAACGPSHKFERNFETCAMGTQHSSGVVAAFPHRVNLKIQGEVPLVALLFCIKPLYIYIYVCVFTCMPVSISSFSIGHDMSHKIWWLPSIKNPIDSRVIRVLKYLVTGVTSWCVNMSMHDWGMP